MLPETDPSTVARFEDELSSMPRCVPAIRAWQLSRVDDAIGTSRWIHMFEQEFSDVEGLMGPYLMHPIHWAVVDRRNLQRSLIASIKYLPEASRILWICPRSNSQ